jgi:hypothetical protein
MNNSQNFTTVDAEVTKTTAASNEWSAPPPILPERFCTTSVPILISQQIGVGQLEEALVVS